MRTIWPFATGGAGVRRAVGVLLCAGVLQLQAPPVAAQEAGPLAAGDTHTCVVLEGGAMKCWGRQEQNQLASGYYLYSTGTPLDVVGIDNAVAISAGDQFTCMLLADGQVKCTGYDRFGQTGPNTCSYADGAGDCALVTGITDAIDIAAGGNHACAVEGDGVVSCWGINNHGQLGLGSQDIGESDLPLPVPGIIDGFAVASGFQHSCALVGAGAVKCWGRNGWGQIGNGAVTADPGELAPVDVPGISDGVAIVAGEIHTCVLHEAGTVSCWGHEDSGALGNPNDPANDYYASPVQVPGIGDAVSITAGDRFTCVVHAAGGASCWGNNYYGQVGNGSNRQNRVAPTGVLDIAGVDLIAGGGSHTCARVSLDPLNVKCWGNGNMGQIGNGRVGGTVERKDPGHVVGAPFHDIFGGDGGSFEAP